MRVLSSEWYLDVSCITSECLNDIYSLVIMALIRPTTSSSTQKPYWHNPKDAAQIHCFICKIGPFLTWSDLDKHFNREHPIFIEECCKQVNGADLKSVEVPA
jgi:hypothetical protein